MPPYPESRTTNYKKVVYYLFDNKGLPLNTSTKNLVGAKDVNTEAVFDELVKSKKFDMLTKKALKDLRTNPEKFSNITEYYRKKGLL